MTDRTELTKSARSPMRDRQADRTKILGDADRETALSLIDAWADLAERKDTEASAAYLLANQHGERLKDMTEARDLCKQQATEAGERLVALLGWLRDNHPRIYAKAPR